MRNNENIDFRYGEDELTIGKALDLARGLSKGVLTEAVRDKVNRNREVVEQIVHKQKNCVRHKYRIWTIMHHINRRRRYQKATI